MEITTEDSKTLAEMLGNHLRSGWYLRLQVQADGLEPSWLDVQFLRMDGNALRVSPADSTLRATTGPVTIPLEKVEAVHIY